MEKAARVRFGIFEFEPDTGDLRREGVAVRLQPQPAQVLAVLVTQAGTVVTREALREAIWGSNTFVDFDRGLNFCVAQIRSALGDSAESPRFVRTVPKRGYQFIAPVARVNGQLQPPPRQHRLLPFVAALGALIAGVLVFGAWRLSSGQKQRIAVTHFDNQTGNPEFDRLADVLTDSVVAELTNANGGRFEVIGNAAILRQSRSKRNLEEIGTSLKAGYIVLGQIQGDGSGTRVLAHLIRLPQQTHISVTRFDRAPEADMAKRIADDVTRRLTASPAPAHR